MAFSSVTQEYLMISISPALILLLSSIIACIYFHLINWKKISSIYVPFLREKWLFIKLNVAVAGVWLCTYYSIYFSSATISIYTFFITGGALSLFLRRNKSGTDIVGIILFCILIFFPYIIYHALWRGISLGILGGIFGLSYNIISGTVCSHLKLTATQTLACRFWLLIFALCFFIPKNFLTQLNVQVLLIIVFIAFLSLILQIWLNQKSVIAIGGKQTSFIASFAPSVTFIIQGIFLNHWFFSVLFLSLLGSLFVAYDHKTHGIRAH